MPARGGRHVALLRGINLGPSTRVPMAGLRELFAGRGATDVVTILNSGNVLYTAPRPMPARGLESDVEAQFGVRTRVILLDVAEVRAVVAAAPAWPIDPARLLCVWVDTPAALAPLRPLVEQSWTPERIALGGRVAYLGCADGVAGSRLWRSVERALDGAGTARNLATMRRVLSAEGLAPA